MDSQPILAVALSYGQVKGKAKQYPYHQAALYRAMARRDGIPTWRYLRHLGTPRRSSRLALNDAQSFADKFHAVLLPQIRHGSQIPTDQTPRD